MHGGQVQQVGDEHGLRQAEIDRTNQTLMRGCQWPGISHTSQAERWCSPGEVSSSSCQQEEAEGTEDKQETTRHQKVDRSILQTISGSAESMILYLNN